MNNFFVDEPLLKVVTESGYIHESFEVDDKIISYEHISGNHPSGTLKTWANIKEYIEAIKKISWINDVEYINKVSEKLNELGFPFSEKEEDNKDEPLVLENFKKEITQAISKYSPDHVDIMFGKTIIYGIFHSRHNGFSVTREYPASIMTEKEIDDYCELLGISSCEE